MASIKSQNKCQTIITTCIAMKTKPFLRDRVNKKAQASWTTLSCLTQKKTWEQASQTCHRTSCTIAVNQLPAVNIA